MTMKIEEKSKNSKSEISERTGKSQSTVQRAIERLTEFGLVKRIGSNKTGYWAVIK